MMQFDEEANLQIMSPAQFKRNPIVAVLVQLIQPPWSILTNKNSTNKFYSRQSIVKSY